MRTCIRCGNRQMTDSRATGGLGRDVQRTTGLAHTARGAQKSPPRTTSASVAGRTWYCGELIVRLNRAGERRWVSGVRASEGKRSDSEVSGRSAAVPPSAWPGPSVRPYLRTAGATTWRVMIQLSSNHSHAQRQSTPLRHFSARPFPKGAACGLQLER